MEYNNFKEELLYKMKKIDIELTEKQVKQFYNYMNLLIEWNNKINLTAITEPKEIILKHFVDCATINKFIDENKVLDIGTGAGFPGIPLKIINEDLEITLADSLNKRIKFLDIVIETLELNKIETIHARAEELAKNKKYRQSYDIVVSRAVAALNVLLEYTTPFIKVGGKVICMKGNNVEEEINVACGKSCITRYRNHKKYNNCGKNKKYSSKISKKSWNTCKRTSIRGSFVSYNIKLIKNDK